MISSARPSDYRLLHRFAFDEDEAAFEELVRRHSGMARGVCRRVLGPAGDADDAAQTAFLSLAQHARTLSLQLGTTGSLAGWLYRVAVNAALQQRRASKARRRREVTVIREREQTSEAAAGTVERAELLAVLDEELKALPSRYRTPLVLCHLEGKTQQDAAEELGLSYGTFRRRLDKGRKLLRARINRRGALVSSVSILAVLRHTISEAAGTSLDLASPVLKGAKKGLPPVAVVKPRVASSGRAPSPDLRPVSVSATAYAVMLAVLLVAMAVPPVLSWVVSNEAGVPAADAAPPTSSSTQGIPARAYGRSAV